MRASSSGARCGISNGSVALRLAEATTAAEAIDLFRCDEGVALRLLGAARQTAFLLRRFFEPFHRLLIERSFAEGGTQLLKACAGDRVIGYLYNFRLGDRDLCLSERVRRCRSARAAWDRHPCLGDPACLPIGRSVYDFMAGRNRLKESFATRCEPMLWQAVQQPRLAHFVLEAPWPPPTRLRRQKPLRGAANDTETCIERPAEERLMSDPSSPAPPGSSVSMSPRRCSSAASG